MEPLADEVLEIEGLSVSFGYQCRTNNACGTKLGSIEAEQEADPSAFVETRSVGAFSCISGAALGANATLPNTMLGGGRIGHEILPVLDSPKSFKPYTMERSASWSHMESDSSSSSASSDSYMQLRKGGRSESAPLHSCVNTVGAPMISLDARTAGGAAGEDRIQAFYSEEEGWLFCAIYDGFNGRDSADFLAGTLYDNVSLNLMHLTYRPSAGIGTQGPHDDDAFCRDVLAALKNGLLDAEDEFMQIVQEEVDERAELAMVGSCVVMVLLHGKYLFTLNLGDSRAILATMCNNRLTSQQLTEDHTVADERERQRVLDEHPDDPSAIVSCRVKGKIALTRAFGAAYLKKVELNDKLIGMLRVRNLISPPYVSSEPYLHLRRLQNADSFVVIASDGLFDFFSNDKVVDLLQHFLASNSSNSDPAKYLIDQLLITAASEKGITLEHLKSIPLGRRRKYHDDVTVMVIILGVDDNNHRTCAASTKDP